MNKENIAATPTFTRKRAKSFSTPPTAKPATKFARGILKGNTGDDAHTIAFIPIHSPSQKKSASAERRRKSLSRRVSFASHASVRLFEKPGEQSPQGATPRRSGRLSPAKSPINNASNESPSRSPDTHADSDGEESEDELTMDMTNVIAQQHRHAEQENVLGSVSNTALDSESESEDDSLPDGDDTAAMDLTDIVPVMSVPTRATTASGTPRRSMLPVRTRPSPKSSRPTVEQNEDEDDQTMDMTTIIASAGPILDPSSPFIGAETTEREMEMTRIVGGILSRVSVTSANESPSRSPRQPAISLSAAMEEDDLTMNMDETRIFSIATDQRPENIPGDEYTSHTSFTVATEEDETQRYCEGSVTQADGFTQNMDLTRALPVQIRTAPALSPVKSAASVGFSWGMAPALNEQSLVDVSMHDVTQSDETMNMDMTQAVPSSLSANVSILNSNDQEQSMNMDFTLVIPAQSRAAEPEADHDVNMSFTQILPPTTPQRSSATALLPHTPIENASSNKTRSPYRPRLSSGAMRSPMLNETIESPSTPATKPRPSTPGRTPSSMRRKSLLDTQIPAFGTPQAKVLLEPGSINRPEFGTPLITGEDARMAMLKEKIQAMTPKKSAPATPAPSTTKQLSHKKESPTKKARFETPQKTPLRSLLAPHASISRNSSAMTPARGATQEPMPQIQLEEFLKMTGISFLTGLSTTRRRETIALPKAFKDVSESGLSRADQVVSSMCVVPMLEMYQHSCRELTRYITEGRAMCTEIESDINDQNPEIFDQYRAANPAERREFEAKFKELKTAARLSAKGVWYVWRENLLSGVLVPLKKNQADLEKEANQLKEFENATVPIFDNSKVKYDELKAAVDALVRDEVLYESFDHDEAARLTKLIEDCEKQSNMEAAGVEALKTQEDAVRTELEVLDQEYLRALAEVTALEEQVEKTRGYSPAEIADMKKTYHDIVQSTGWKLQHADHEVLKLALDDSLQVAISLIDMSMHLSLPASLTSDAIRTYYLHHLAQTLADFRQSHPAAKKSLKFIRDQWSAVATLMRELRILETVYPLSVRVNEDDNVQATAAVLLPASRTKFVVDFISTPSISQEECSLDVAVNVKYGGLDGIKVQQHIQARLHSQPLQSRPQGWLLDSLRMPDGL